MFLEKLSELPMQIKDVFMNIDPLSDILDILLVTAVIYGIITQLRKSQSIQVIKGLVFLVVVYGLVCLFNMETSHYIFSRLFNDIIIIFVVLFATEIRQGLESVGKKRISKHSFFSSSNEDEQCQVDAINAVCRACGAMSQGKVGSLIVFQRESLLGDLTKQAVPIDSETTYEMICSIFYPNAPLHDGAVVIKDGRIIAARCVVPMKNDRVVTEHVGTRHRAAIEVSLNSDAIAVVTSEETGIISIAVDGQLIRGLTDSELREKLGSLILTANTKKPKKDIKKKEDVEIKEEEKENVGSGNDAENASDVSEKPEEVKTVPEEIMSENNKKILNEGDADNEQE